MVSRSSFNRTVGGGPRRSRASGEAGAEPRRGGVHAGVHAPFRSLSELAPSRSSGPFRSLVAPRCSGTGAAHQGHALPKPRRPSRSSFLEPELHGATSEAQKPCSRSPLSKVEPGHHRSSKGFRKPWAGELGERPPLSFRKYPAQPNPGSSARGPSRSPKLELHRPASTETEGMASSDDGATPTSLDTASHWRLGSGTALRKARCANGRTSAPACRSAPTSGSLQPRPIRPRRSPTTSMGAWLRHAAQRQLPKTRGHDVHRRP